MSNHIVDLTKLPSAQDIDRSILPEVEEEWTGDRQVIVSPIGRFNSGYEYYAPVGYSEDGVPLGGMLSLSEAQVRHLYAEFSKHVTQWDAEDTPEDPWGGDK